MSIYDITKGIPSSIEIGDVLECPYTGAAIALSLRKGQYRLECWGAQGGNANAASTQAGGLGGYAYGNLSLTASTDLYVYTGGAGIGIAGNGNQAGGWNGGGAGGYNRGGSGGGASDIRRGGTELSDRIIVAGGGGGGCYYSTYTGGAGGGESGGNGTGYNTTYAAKGATQAAGGAAGGYSGSQGTAGTLGQGGDANATATAYCRSGGGGGGYYGGGGGGYRSSSSYYYYGCSGGGGGSSYLASVLTESGAESGVREGDGLIRITVLNVGPDPVTNLRQTAQEYESISLAWDRSPDAIGYRVYLDGVLKSTQTGLTCTITGLEPSTKYTVSVTPYDAESGGKSAAIKAETKVGYRITRLVITSAALSPNPCAVRSSIKAAVTAATETLIVDPEYLYSGEMHSAER